MTETKKSVHEALSRVLAAELDPYLVSNGFSRDSDSLDYVRRWEDGEQKLELHFTYKPSLDSRANAHIYPELSLKFPEVNRIASEMVGGQHGVIGTTDLTLWQPMDFVIPKEAHVYWFTYGREEDYVLCVRSIQGYIEKWIIPFLNSYTSIASLTSFYENIDERIHPQRHFYIYVAAAYVLMNQPTKAMEVLEAKFGKAGPRRDYAKAFEYVGKLLNK